MVQRSWSLMCPSPCFTRLKCAYMKVQSPSFPESDEGLISENWTMNLHSFPPQTCLDPECSLCFNFSSPENPTMQVFVCMIEHIFKKMPLATIPFPMFFLPNKVANTIMPLQRTCGSDSSCVRLYPYDTYSRAQRLTLIIIPLKTGLYCHPVL